MNETLTTVERRLELGGSLWLCPSWLDTQEADALLRDLRASIPWTQGTILLFGRVLREPRLTAWIGDLDYSYSGRTVHAAPWPPALAALRTRLEAATGSAFNAVLLNLYRDGEDSMGMHSDDEPELGRDPVIASVSLGAKRTFVLEPKKKGARLGGRQRIVLGHGSLLVMGGACQHHYRHGIPKDPASTGDRLNLTFRLIRAKDV